MLIAIDKPVGIDAAIVKLQTKLESSLMTTWNLSDPSQYMCYGRCSKNRTTDGGYAAEVFDPTTGDYKDVYFDDTISAISFFSSADKVVIDKGQGKVAVGLIYFVDLSKVKTSLHRADEEVRLDIIKLIGYSSFGFALSSIETGVDNVLKEYPGSRRDKRLASLDMGSRHAFRINLNLIYQNN